MVTPKLGVQITDRTPEDQSFLSYCAHIGNLGFVQYLYKEHKMDLNDEANHMMTPFLYAIKAGNLYVLHNLKSHELGK